MKPFDRRQSQGERAGIIALALKHVKRTLRERLKVAGVPAPPLLYAFPRRSCLALWLCSSHRVMISPQMMG